MDKNYNFLNKEVLKLFKQYQEQLAYEPFGPHFSRIQEKEYKQKCEELMHHLKIEEISPNDKSLAFRHMAFKPYLIGGDIL